MKNHLCDLVTEHLKGCPKCMDRIVKSVIKAQTSAAGSVKSKKKAKSSRENGKLGGRPRKL